MYRPKIYVIAKGIIKVKSSIACFPFSLNIKFLKQKTSYSSFSPNAMQTKYHNNKLEMARCSTCLKLQRSQDKAGLNNTESTSTTETGTDQAITNRIEMAENKKLHYTLISITLTCMAVLSAPKYVQHWFLAPVQVRRGHRVLGNWNY